MLKKGHFGILTLIVGIMLVLSFAACDNSTTAASGGNDTAKVATPVATPGTGAVAAGTTVTLSTTTAGATIRYTTDGVNPTAASVIYSTPITINAAMTIKVIAIKEGMADSDMITSAYTITANIDPDKPIEPGITIIDVDCGNIAEIALGDVNQNTLRVLSDLALQAATIRDQFASWQAELESTGGTPEQIEFAETVQLYENSANIVCTSPRYNNITEIRSRLSGYDTGLATAVRSLFTDENAGAVFQNQLTLLQVATGLNSRMYFKNGEQAKMVDRFITDSDNVERLTGTSIPRNPIEAAAMLRPIVESAMPETAGPYRAHLLQQFVDYTEFGAYSNDTVQIDVNMINRNGND